MAYHALAHNSFTAALQAKQIIPSSSNLHWLIQSLSQAAVLDSHPKAYSTFIIMITVNDKRVKVRTLETILDNVRCWKIHQQRKGFQLGQRGPTKPNLLMIPSRSHRLCPLPRTALLQSRSINALELVGWLSDSATEAYRVYCFDCVFSHT